MMAFGLFHEEVPFTCLVLPGCVPLYLRVNHYTEDMEAT